MYVLIDLQLGDVELAEPEDTKRFHVAVAHGTDAAAADEVLRRRGVGRLEVDEAADDERAVVDVGWVRAEASGRVGGRWVDDFGSMLDHARGKGWLVDDGRSLVAHVEWIGEEG